MKTYLVCSHPSLWTGISRYAKDLWNGMDYDGFLVHPTVPDKSLVHFSEPYRLSRKPSGSTLIVTVHDLAPLNSRNRCDVTDSWLVRQAARLFYAKRLDDSTKNADLIIANSTQTREELLERYPRYEPKIRMVNMGVSEKFKETRIPDIAKPKSIGTLTHYRTEVVERIARHLGNDIRNISPIGHVEEALLVNYYNSLDCYIHTLFYEGFGYPIVEAVACGRPVITFTAAAIPKEVKSLTNIVEDEAGAIGMIQSGNLLTYVNPFRLNKMIDGTRAVYRETESFNRREP